MQIYLSLCVPLRRAGYLGERNTEMNQSPSGEQGGKTRRAKRLPPRAQYPDITSCLPFPVHCFLRSEPKVQNLISMGCGSKINLQRILKAGWEGREGRGGELFKI